MTTARESALVLYGAAADRPDEADGVVQAEAIAGALSRLGWWVDLMPLDLDLSALSSPRVRRAALLFNVVDSLAGDSRLGPVVPSVLAVLGLPYTGCDATSQLAATNKALAKRLMRSEAIPTPPWSYDGGGFAAGNRVIVKSVWEHASVGLDAGSVVEARDARRARAARAARFGGEWFVERYVEGRELSISMLQSATGVEMLPAAEIEFVDFPPERPRIVDYEAKWIVSSFAYQRTPRRFVLPTDERSLVSRLCALARQCWSLFGLAGYARVDFRVDGDGAPWVIDVNANPCLSPDAGFAAAAQAAGMDYDAVVARIAASARTRAGDMATVA